MSVILKSSVRQKLLKSLISSNLAQVSSFLEKNKLSWSDCTSDGFSVEDIIVCHAKCSLVKEFLNYNKDYKLSKSAFQHITCDSGASLEQEGVFCDLLQNNLLLNTQVYTSLSHKFLEVFSQKKATNQNHFKLLQIGSIPKSEEDFLLNLYFDHFMGYYYDKNKVLLYTLDKAGAQLDQSLQRQTRKLLGFIKGLNSQSGGLRSLGEKERDSVVQVFIQLLNLLRLNGRMSNFLQDLDLMNNSQTVQEMQRRGGQQRLEFINTTLISFFLDCCQVDEFCEANVLQTLQSYSFEFNSEFVGICEQFEKKLLQRKIETTQVSGERKIFKV